MSKTEKLTRIYAAWLLIWSDRPEGADASEFDEAVGTVVDQLLEPISLESWQIHKDWKSNLPLL